ncbi:autotransporter-associated beta strand repeat-containing protein, partial [Paraburkholderia sediminicola]|nr:autotransporter-associated beta strand repeat-containing protein [Paraburkholderia sediminicola]
MNRVFSTTWSKSRGVWVVVSELGAKGARRGGTSVHPPRPCLYPLRSTAACAPARTARGAFSGSALLVAALCAPCAQATIVTWDASGVATTTSTATDGGGNWDTSTLRWNNNVVDHVWSNAAGDTAVIGNGNGTAGTLTLTTPITVGGLIFNAPGSGSYTLTGSTLNLIGSQTITANANATMTSPLNLAGTLTKNGTGTLTLTGVSIYTGPTAVNAGTLSVGNGGIVGSISGASPISVAAGATMQWYRADAADYVISNSVSGAGTLYLRGTDTPSNSQGRFDLTGNNAGLTGALLADSARVGVAAPSEVGSSIWNILNHGQIYLTGTAQTYGNNIVVGAGADGWYEGAGNFGNLRSDAATTLTGNISVAATGNLILGSNTTATSYLTGVISGAGGVSLSTNTSASTFVLGGNSSNTYTGATTLQGNNASSIPNANRLNLAKTGGAVAIAAGNVVNFAPGARTFLNMGDTTTFGVGAVRHAWDNQFGTGVTLNWQATAGNWGEFSLQGTNQTLAGFNSTRATASMVVENQSPTGQDPGADATLTLNGSGTYAAYGYVRDQQNGGTTRKLNIVKNGTGMQTIGDQASGTINYTGTTTVNSGILAHDTTLSAATGWNSAVTVNAGGEFRTSGTQFNQGQAGGTITLNGGVLSHTTTAANAWKVWAGLLTIAPAGGTINVNNTNTTNNNVFFDAGIAGSGTLTLNTTGGGNNGIVFRSAVGSYSGALQANSGNVFVNGTAGLVFQNSDVTLGAGATLRLDANWAGSAANASVKSLSGAGNVTLGAQTLTVGTNNGTGSHAGVISGTGALVKTGTGTQTLSGNDTYSGPTTVSAGSLLVNGNQSGATGQTSVAAGATLGGTGTIGGSVMVANGGILTPGVPGPAPGQLTINGNLSLGAGSILNYRFGQGGVVGGPLDDLTTAGGNLTLAGTLNVTAPPGGNFGAGIYRVINYAGTLTNNGLALGTTPPSPLYVQTSVANQVNLVNSTGLTLNFWDGAVGPKNNSVVNGGNGIWQNASGNDNWTNASGAINAPFSNGSFAVFTAQPGAVTVDNSLGQVNVSGMQFASNGYVIGGGSLALVGSPTTTIRVGDGTAAGAGYTATINSVLTGASQLAKTDLGTLVLSAANAYTGGTAINGGVLQIASDANLGAASGALSLDGGTLRTTADLTTARGTTLGAGGGTFETQTGTLTHSGVISGTGVLTKAGTGTLLLTTNDKYSGGTIITAGTLQLGNGGTSGSVVGNVADSGMLAFNRSDTLNFGGIVSGTGSITQAGPGTAILTADSTYSGGTTIAAGTLQLGNGGTSGGITGNVTDNGTLAFNRSDTVSFGGIIAGIGALTQLGSGTTILTGNSTYSGPTMVQHGTLQVDGSIQSPTTILPGATLAGSGTVAGDVVNQGTVWPGIPMVGDTGYGVLTIRGNYRDPEGQLVLNTFLGSDGSPSSRLVLDGGTAGGPSTVVVHPTGQSGVLTRSNGITVVQAINGGTTTADAFELAPGELRAGAFDYRLFRGGTSGNAPDDWFLRSDLIVPSVPGAPPGASGQPPLNAGQPASLALHADPPPAVLPPGEYPIIGAEIATYSVVQPLARQMGLTTLGTMHERIGDTLTQAEGGTGSAGWG